MNNLDIDNHIAVFDKDDIPSFESDNRWDDYTAAQESGSEFYAADRKQESL